ncbi:tyrosine-protein kinase Tec-like [Ptychodera flava]|uniref:tyrosine-protein kinase Tec-like n=1 Tax=Ptychodera flava TaxID=63121 RepID=UPI00396A1245
MFGSNCSEECLCHTEYTISCDSEKGWCKCTEGVCGGLCEEKCSCRSWEKSTCNGTSGCHCEEVSPGQDSYEALYRRGVIIAIIVLSVLAIFGAAVVVLRNKHKNKMYQRLEDEEREICNVFKENIGQCEYWSIQPARLTKSNELLGQGSFGQVYKGNFKPQGSKITEDVAIKSLLPARRNYQCCADFAREISCLIQLQGHPNIVILKGIVLQQGDNCLVMECSTCGDLLNYLHCLGKRISKKTEKELLCYTRHITLGMQYMQQKKILHRDLSARNILLFNEGVAKISDFGLSRDASETKGVYVKLPWAENQTALPLKWMPPEFLTRGEFYYKSDVWSFGVLLWEICTHGDSPFKEDTPYQFIRRIARGERLPRPNTCTEESYQVIRQCWQSPLQMRPSAEQLIPQIEHLMNNEGLFNEIYDENPIEPFDHIE